MSSPGELIIRPVLLEDAEALWTITRGQSTCTNALASSLRDVANERYFQRRTKG
jgi:hypothetical protein